MKTLAALLFSAGPLTAVVLAVAHMRSPLAEHTQDGGTILATFLGMAGLISGWSAVYWEDKRIQADANRTDEEVERRAEQLSYSRQAREYRDSSLGLLRWAESARLSSEEIERLRRELDQLKDQAGDDEA